MSAAGRTYRFAARDRSGWLLGLQAGQCIILGAGIFVAGGLFNVGAPSAAVIVTIAISGVFAFAPAGDRPAYAWLPVLVSWIIGGRGGPTWTASVPRFGRTAPESAQPEWPPFLEGLELHEHAGWRANEPMAAVVNRRTGELTAMLRVSGREFALIDRLEQERVLAGWGDALAAFCKERSAVSAVRWFEWSAPADASEHLRWSRTQIATDADPEIVDGYLAMVAEAGPMATRHETLVTITVGGPTSGFGRRQRSRHGRALVDTLRDELRLLAGRLDATGLIVDRPLSSADVATMLRARLDPFTRGLAAPDRQTLAQLAGVSPRSAGPMATRTEWNHLMVDGAVHACFAITEWPRLDVPPNWMEPLLLHAGGTRTIAVHLDPVAPLRSQRQIDRDSTRLVVDAEQRSRSGFRVGARHRRTESDVASRESELVAGYAEFEYCGLVTVSAPDIERLERSCTEWEQIAAHAGLQLRRLNAQHDAAFACTLPVGIGPTARSWE